MTDDLHPPMDDANAPDDLAGDPMIARMRSALDEAARVEPATAAPAPAPDRRRWIAVAAAGVLVVGAVAALAVNMSRDHAPAAEPVPSAGTLLTGQAAIIDTGEGPKMAVTLLASMPPQGGDIPLAGFDWSMVADEQTAGAITWTDTFQQLTGTWDGATFTLTTPPVPAVVSTSTSTPVDQSCPDATAQAAADAISRLDVTSLHLTEWYPQTREGVCGVHVRAWFDTQELRDALDGVRAAGHDVQVQYVFNPVPTDTTDPATTTTGLSSGGADAWYEIAAPGLTAQPPEFTLCCPPMPAPGPDVVMAWTDNAGGLFMLQAVGHVDGSPAELRFSSHGMDDGRVAELAAKVVPGSGLPYVLDDPSMTLLAQGFDGIGASVSQRYTTADGAGDVLLTIGDYMGALGTYAGPLLEDTTVAGQPGYRIAQGGVAVYMWRTPDKSWAELMITGSAVGRADEIVASLTPAPPPTDTATTSTTVAETKPADTILPPDATATTADLSWPHADVTYVTGEPLPPYDSSVIDSSGMADPAIGMPAPEFGATPDASAFGPRPLVPTLVVFTATWCPHCTATLPDLIAAETNGLLDGVHVVIVQTANSSGVALYDEADYVRWGHTEPVLVDQSMGDGAAGTVATAYGATGWPYFVLVGTDGRVLGRSMGEISPSDLQAFIATAVAKAG